MRGGFGFVTPEEDALNGEDIFIPANACGGAWDGDTVEVSYRARRAFCAEGKRYEGRVKRIIRFGYDTLCGVLYPAAHSGKRGAALCFVADHPRIPTPLPVSHAGGGKAGDKVQVSVQRTGNGAQAHVLCVFGAAHSRAAIYGAILAECGVETVFTPEEKEQAQKASVLALHAEGRVDLRGEPILTIDAEGAKDLDDAVSVQRQANGTFILGVHIADVSLYVEERTPLDRLALRRATSIYFTDKVVPMLPEELSNGACSLNAGEDRYTLSAFVTLSREGEIEKTEIVPSLIRSRVRGVYSEVNDLFDKKTHSDFYEKYRDMYTSLCIMRELYEILARKSVRRGALDLEIPEAVILLDETGMPCDIFPSARGVAQKMIEQFMLTANEGVARVLHARAIPCVYRVHRAPPADKLETFLSYVRTLGIDTRTIPREGCCAKDFAAVLAEAKERDCAVPVSHMLLRSLSKAEYSDREPGHFGLSIPLYCHFTSPIRRLSDLAVHRILHRVLLEGESPARYAAYAKRAAAAATQGELRALQAERRIDDLYKALYMKRHIGETFPATISALGHFGVFAMLANTCEGLIALSELPGVFLFDEQTQTLRSADMRLRVGEALIVRVEEADIDRGKVRFSLVQAPAPLQEPDHTPHAPAPGQAPSRRTRAHDKNLNQEREGVAGAFRPEQNE